MIRNSKIVFYKFTRNNTLPIIRSIATTHPQEQAIKQLLKTTAIAAVLAASFTNTALAQINVTPMKGVKTVQVTNQ